MAIRNMVVRNQMGMTGGVIGYLMTHGLGALSAGGGAGPGLGPMSLLGGLRRRRASVLLAAFLLLWAG